MKTKPKLVRVLPPPVSMMMMQHQHQERLCEEDTQASVHRRASLDTALSEINKGGSSGRVASAKDALFDTLVQSKPLAPLNFSPNTSPPGGGYKITHLTVHPNKPLSTYVLSWGTDDGSELTSSSGSGTSGVGGGVRGAVLAEVFATSVASAACRAIFVDSVDEDSHAIPP